jgi:hypothetical protein
MRGRIPPFSVPLSVNESRRSPGRVRGRFREEDVMWGDWIPLALIAVVFAVFFLAGGGGG